MEALIVLLILLWLIGRLFGENTGDSTPSPDNSPERQGPRRTEHIPGERTESMQDALREIQRQLGGEPQERSGHHWEETRNSGGADQPAPASTPSPSNKTSYRDRFRDQQSRDYRRGRSDATGERDVEDVHFPDEISEAASTRDRAPSGAEERRSAYELRSRVRRRLRTREGRREAFLLKELIDRPVGQRPWPR